MSLVQPDFAMCSKPDSRDILSYAGLASLSWKTIPKQSKLPLLLQTTTGQDKFGVNVHFRVLILANDLPVIPDSSFWYNISSQQAKPFSLADLIPIPVPHEWLALRYVLMPQCGFLFICLFFSKLITFVSSRNEAGNPKQGLIGYEPA